MDRAKEIKIAVFGAGAMGTALGALLTKGGLKNVDLITRNRAHVEGLREKGAVLHYTDGKKEAIPVRALLPEEMSGQYDVVFLMTKQRYNAQTVRDLLPHLREDGIVCTTQNGLPEQSVAEVIGAERTYGAVTSFGVTFIGKGEISLTSKTSGMRVEIGGYRNGGEKLPLLQEILDYVGKAIGRTDFAVVSEDLLGARWAKLSINAAFSGLSVVTGRTFGEIANRRNTRKIALCILRECLHVAHALDVQMSTPQGRRIEKYLGGDTPMKRFVAYLLLPFAMREHKKLVSGMLADVQKGKRCEIDFIDGTVVREGARACVETPYCQKVVEIVHGIEDGLYEMTYKNMDFFDFLEE